jgi:hypothetical protein
MARFEDMIFSPNEDGGNYGGGYGSDGGGYGGIEGSEPMGRGRDTPPPPNYQDILYNQIMGQNLSGKWTGQGFGSAEANAKDMARILDSIGITDIKQFGKVTVEEDVPYFDEYGSGFTKQTKETFGNKLTGQAVPNTYSERQQGDFFGGTFAGKGNTGYGVKFAPDGTPIFYTQGASSSDLANNKILNAVANFAAFTIGGPLGVGALQLAQGNDLEAAAKAALLSYAGQEITNAIGGADVSSVTPSDLTQIDLAIGGGAPTVADFALTGSTDLLSGIPTDSILPQLTASDLGIDYSLANAPVTGPLTDMGGAQGIQAGTSANLGDLGGGQGITLNVGAPVTTVADAINAISGVNPANLPSMGGGQGLTLQTPTGLVTQDAILNVGGLTGNNSVIGGTGIDTATNIGSDIVKRVDAIDTGVDKIELPPSTPTVKPDKTYTTSEIIDMIRLGVLGATVLGGATQDSGPTGYPIVPVPADWKSPTYAKDLPSVAPTQLPPIDFGTRELLRGTQWERLLDPNYGKTPAPVQFNQPTDMSYDRLMNILGAGRDVMPSQALTINDVISGIQNQYGQTTNSAMGQKPT